MDDNNLYTRENRQIRKVLQYCHCTVTRLIRISYGDYHLGTIPKGMVQEVVTNGDENDEQRQSNKSSTKNNGIIPYHQHVRRGRLFLNRSTTQNANRNEQSSSAAAAAARATKQKKSNHNSEVVSSTPPIATPTKTTKRTPNTSSSSRHQPVQWIRL